MENNNTQAYLKNTNWKHNGELLNYACKIIDNEIKLGHLSEDTKIKNLINDRLYSFAEKLAKKFNVSVNEAIGELKNAYVLHSVNYHINKSEKNESKNRLTMKQTIKLNESQLKKIVAESVKRMLTEHDDRIKKVNKIIEAEFGNLINLDNPVNGPEYYVNGNPETTWRQYLLFNLRHRFGLMTNVDVQYLPTVARLAFSDEVGFDKRNDNGEQISKLNKVIQAFKLNPNFFLMAKNNPNMSLEDLYNRMGYMGTNVK